MVGGETLRRILTREQAAWGPEVALYAFAFLILSGTYLALFFSPDISSKSTYAGPFDDLPPAAAIANAVEDAVGSVRVQDGAPATASVQAAPAPRKA